MVLARPSCPSCGSEFLVAKARTAGGYLGKPSETFYRCYRCSNTFTSEDGNV